MHGVVIYNQQKSQALIIKEAFLICWKAGNQSMFQSECDPDGDGWCRVRETYPSTCPCLGPTQDDVEYKEVNGVLLGMHKENPTWDLLIAHPECRYLSVSGMHWTTRGFRDPKLTDDAIQFAEKLWLSKIPKICVENPVGVLSTRSKLGKSAQTIQPYQFGHDASKATCLWLKGLPDLRPTKSIFPRMVKGKPRWSNQCDSGQNKLGPSEKRSMDRARTYEGIAQAMAEQWG